MELGNGQVGGGGGSSEICPARNFKPESQKNFKIPKAVVVDVKLLWSLLMRIFMVLLSLLGFGMEMFLILMMLFRLLALCLLQLMLSVLWSWLVCCWCCCHCCANYHYKNLLIVLSNLIVLYLTSLILFVVLASYYPALDGFV